MGENQVTVVLEQKKGFEFLVKFDEGIDLLMDEPAPLGEDRGPSATKVLSAAIGNCLSASLLFCLQKARIDIHNIKTTVTTKLARNEKNRIRIDSSHVKIEIDAEREEAVNRFNKCAEIFEDFCVVTASVRKGIEVSVEVVDQAGKQLYQSA